MNRRIIVRSLAAALLVLPFASCSSLQNGFSGVFKKKAEAGPEQVDDLLDRIERVHVDCELAGKSVRETIGLLQAMTARNFKGDPAQAYTRYLEAIELSERRSDELKKSIQPMRAAAEPFFAQWSASLGAFTNPEMRRHSQTRLTETRERYQAIIASVEPAHATFDAYNRGLHDHALFLGHDFNPNSVAAIQGELRGLAKLAVEVGGMLDTSRAAARAYVESSSLPVQVEASDR